MSLQGTEAVESDHILSEVQILENRKKFEICLPNTAEDSLRIVRDVGNYYWEKAINK